MNEKGKTFLVGQNFDLLSQKDIEVGWLYVGYSQILWDGDERVAFY